MDGDEVYNFLAAWILVLDRFGPIYFGGFSRRHSDTIFSSRLKETDSCPFLAEMKESFSIEIFSADRCVTALWGFYKIYLYEIISLYSLANLTGIPHVTAITAAFPFSSDHVRRISVCKKSIHFFTSFCAGKSFSIIIFDDYFCLDLQQQFRYIL